MTRSLKHRTSWISAACAVALAAAWSASERAAASPAAAMRGSSLSLVETLVLLRWGEGALDWTLPDVKDPRGETHARIRDPRA